MRTTLRIDKDLMMEIKSEAHRLGVSLTRLVNRLLRRSLESGGNGASRKRAFRQRTYAMGEPLIGLDKALSIAAALEDEATLEKLRRRA